jgi:predicted ATPase/DNA-binding CsgD family transcriptional regulator
LRQRRLVTVVGAAGAGKTRLALEISRVAPPHYPGGVLIAGLAPVPCGSLVLSTVSATLGITAGPQELTLDALTESIGEKRMLLILDNAEHVAEACAELCDALLGRCPQLHVLTTSREALRVSGEAVFQVDGMYMPSLGDEPSTAVLRRSDAVQFFAYHAKAVDRDFSLTPANLTLVATVCGRLDGMPLAIELAARRLGTMSLQDISDRLGERLDLLAAVSPHSIDRHQDLRAAISWSYRLLTPLEQHVFCRLSLSPRGMSLDCATAVCTRADVSPDDVLQIMASLATKSLVVPAGLDQEVARFVQLESIRLFGLECLSQSGELEDASERLVTWLFEKVTPLAELLFSTTSDLIAMLEAEQEALLYATQWTAERHDPRHVLLATALARCWQERGQIIESRRLLEDAARNIPPDALYLSTLFTHRAWLARWQEDYAEAAQLAQEAVELARKDAAPLPLAVALSACAFMALASGDLDSANGLYRRCIDIVREHGHPLDAARCLHNLAYALLIAGDVDAAAGLLDEALPDYRRHAQAAARGAVAHTAGAVALVRGDFVAAEECFVEALQAGPEATYEFVLALEGIAVVRIANGSAVGGLRLAAAAERIRDEAGFTRDPWWAARLGSAVDDAVSVLSNSAAARATQAGRQLTKERALSEALSAPPGERERYSAVLSDRETEIAALVASGLSNRRIARHLSIVERTVATHLDSIRAKLGLRTRTEIAVWVVQNQQRGL